VREGILALLLAQVFAAPLPTVIAIVARLWMVLAELLGAGVALVIWRKRKPSVKPHGVSPAHIADQPTAEAGRVTAELISSAPDPAAACDGEVV
jgi:hypothetical protein